MTTFEVRDNHAVISAGKIIRGVEYEDSMDFSLEHDGRVCVQTERGSSYYVSLQDLWFAIGHLRGVSGGDVLL